MAQNFRMIGSPGNSRAATWMRAFVLSLATVGGLLFIEGIALLLNGVSLVATPPQRSSVTDFAWSESQQVGVATFWGTVSDSGEGVMYSAALIAPDDPGGVSSEFCQGLAPRHVLAGPHGDLVLACEDGSLHLLETVSLKASRPLLGRHPDGEPEALARTADGAILLSRSPKHLCAWDVTRQRLLWLAPAEQIESMATHPVEGRLLCGRTDGSIEVRDAASGVPLREFLVQDGPVTGLACCPNGQQVASVRGSSELVVWQFGTGERLWSAPLLAAVAKSLSVSHDGRWLAIAATVCGRFEVICFEVASGSAKALAIGPARCINGTLFTRSGQLFCWGADGALRLCNIDSLTEVMQWSPAKAIASK